MSVEQTKIIDFVGFEKTTGSIVLTISDHLDWSENQQKNHIKLLQDKINTYLSYIEGGQIFRDYPDARNHRKIYVISVVGKYNPEGDGIRFFDSVREILKHSGYGFRIELL